MVDVIHPVFKPFIVESTDGLGMKTIIFTVDSRFRDIQQYKYSTNFKVKFGQSDKNIWRPYEIKELDKPSNIVLLQIIQATIPNLNKYSNYIEMPYINRDPFIYGIYIARVSNEIYNDQYILLRLEEFENDLYASGPEKHNVFAKLAYDTNISIENDFVQPLITIGLKRWQSEQPLNNINSLTLNMTNWYGQPVYFGPDRIHITQIYQNIDGTLNFTHTVNITEIPDTTNWNDGIESGDILIFSCFNTDDPSTDQALTNKMTIGKYQVNKIGEYSYNVPDVQCPAGGPFTIDGYAIRDKMQVEFTFAMKIIT